MGFVKTPAEVERLQALLHAPRFHDGRVLLAVFLTDPHALAAVLPPPLQLGRRPRVTVQVCEWESECVGAFKGGSVLVSARLGDEAGDYPLAMWMDSGPSVLFGRDLFGEPKKLCAAALEREGDRFHGWIDRHGRRIVEMRATLGAEHPPGSAPGTVFNVKAQMAAGGIGLAGDATITRMAVQTDLRVHRDADVELTLRGSPHDPLDELPVLEPLGGRYLEGDQEATCAEVGTIPAGVFLPFHLGRSDDPDALAVAPAGSAE